MLYITTMKPFGKSRTDATKKLPLHYGQNPHNRLRKSILLYNFQGTIAMTFYSKIAIIEGFTL